MTMAHAFGPWLTCHRGGTGITCLSRMQITVYIHINTHAMTYTHIYIYMYIYIQLHVYIIQVELAMYINNSLGG